MTDIYVGPDYVREEENCPTCAARDAERRRPKWWQSETAFNLGWIIIGILVLVALVRL